MSRTLVDIDDDVLELAMHELGTTTKRETVNRALAESVAAAARRRHLERLKLGGLPDLADDDVRQSAWR